MFLLFTLIWIPSMGLGSLEDHNGFGLWEHCTPSKRHWPLLSSFHMPEAMKWNSQRHCSASIKLVTHSRALHYPHVRTVVCTLHPLNHTPAYSYIPFIIAVVDGRPTHAQCICHHFCMLSERRVGETWRDEQ